MSKQELRKVIANRLAKLTKDNIAKQCEYRWSVLSGSYHCSSGSHHDFH